MKTRIHLRTPLALCLAVAALGAGLSGCSDQHARAQPAPLPGPAPAPAPRPVGPEVQPIAPPAPEARSAAEALNVLALRLYEDLRAHAGEDDNLFFSPASIQAALALALAGADTGTEAAIRRTLALGGTRAEAIRALGALGQLLERDKDKDGIELTVANRVWGAKKLEWLDTYLSDLREFFDATPGVTDFAEDFEGSRKAINAWIAESTQGLIPELFPFGTITRDTRAVLANAIYFKGDWESAFAKASTEKQPFFVRPGVEVDVDLMFQQGLFKVAVLDGVKVLELPYKGGSASMIIALPDERGGIAALEARLAADPLGQLERWTSRMGKRRKVRVWMPRFELNRSAELGEVLGRLGMAVAFTNAADFTRMVKKELLKIDKVIHQAVIKVDEEGTVAAAATGITMVGITSVRRPDEPIQFRADHPFVFAIRDNTSGGLLFMGRLVNPAS